jgi:hypothetical protein
METYRVTVFTPGHIILFRNKQARTPVTFKNLKESEVALIDAQARRSLLRYESVKESEIEECVTEEINFLTEDIKVEELVNDKEPSTILEKTYRRG